MPTSENPRPSLGEYLKNRRALLSRTQRQIGGTALGPGYIGGVESGTIADVSVTKLIQLSEAYELPITAILSDVYGIDSVGPTVDYDALAIGATVQSLPEDKRERTIEWITYQAGQQHTQ